MSNLPATADIDPDDLPQLTDKQYKYAIGLINGLPLIDAYRQAGYSTESMSIEGQYVQASRLQGNAKIALWISFWKRQALERGAVTLDGHLAELARLKELSIATGNLGAATKAEELRGKAAGVYLGDDQGRLAKVPAAQLIAIVREGIGGIEGEEAAQKLAKRLGVTLLPNPQLTIDHVPTEETG